MSRPRSFLATLASVIFAALATTPSLSAQDFPWPTKKGEVPAATHPSSGKPLYPYDTPIKDHLGRFVDSSSVRDYQAGPRTLRAKETFVDKTSGRLYMRMGERFAAWDLSTFFSSKIGSPLTSQGINHPSATSTESYLAADLFVDPEAPGSGWQIYIIDGQQRLYDFDIDDRGYIYLAYYVWGWGIVQKDGLSLVKQVPWTETDDPQLIKHFRNGSKHYVMTGAGATEIWDVTNPTTPVKVREVPLILAHVDTVQVGNSDVLALLDTTGNVLRLYHAADIVAGGGPFKTISSTHGGWRGLTNDGSSFIAAESNVARTGAHLTTVTSEGVTSSFPIGDLKPEGIFYSDGHVTVWGRAEDRIFDCWLWERKGSSWAERSLGNYFRRHYINAPDGYDQPNTVYNAVPWKLEYLSYQGKEYLFYSGFGLGDVYELEAANRLKISLNGVGGTQNPNRPSSSTGTFYGDPLRFSSEYQAGAITVNWNFGNPEGLAPLNQQTLPVGTNVTYQYAGLTTAAAIQSPRTVTATDTADSTNVSTTTVSMQAPTARIRVLGTDTLVPDANLAESGVAAGDQFVDASDGTIEGHYGVWTLDGTDSMGTPAEPFAVGGCGQHSLNFSAHYVPYTGTGAAIVPVLGEAQHFVRTVGPVSYEVRPFIPDTDSVSSGTQVTFRNKTRFKAGSFTNGAQWTVTWALRDQSGATIQSETDTTPVGTLDTFIISKASLNPNYSVLMTVTVDAASVTDASCAVTNYLSASSTLAVQPPDPSITVTGCTVAKSTCELTAGSVSGADMSGWSFQWYLDGALASSSATYNPTFNEAGTHQVKLVATNNFGSGEATRTLTLSAPLCSGEPYGITFSARGLTSGCTGSNCKAGETIQFLVYHFGYNFQDCDTFSWTFGDGTTSSLKEPTHVFPTSPSSYTVRLTVSNTNGSVSYSSTVSFGSTPPPPTCTGPGAGTVFPSFQGSQSGCSTSNPNCNLNETIQFTGATWGYNVQPACDSFSWNFGDGQTSSQRHPTHTYTQQGTYTVRFTITNSGGSAFGTTTITVGEPEDPNCRKEAVLLDLAYTGQTSGCSSAQGNSTGCLTGETITFEPVTWQYNWQPCDEFLWKFGDGTTSTEQSPTHVYAASQSGKNMTVEVTVSNKHGTTTVSRTFLVGTPATKPTSASFSYAPSNPKPGQTVTFTGSTNGGDPATQWAWDFGDGATGSGQTVTHTFATEGSFKVLLRASNSGGDAFQEKTLSVNDRITYLLPVVTHAAGANSTSWRTDLHVFQPQFAAPGISVELEFKGTSKTIFFDSSTEIFEDFLSQIKTGDDAGPVFLHSPVPIDMWTRTYVVGPSGVGTYGQLIPAVRLGGAGTGGAVADETFWNIGGLKNTQRYRTNLGFVNPTGQRADVTVHIYEDQFGLEIGRFDVSISPYWLDQKPLKAWFADLPSDKGFSLRIQSRNGVEVISYASIIDNISNDPVYVGAIPDSQAAKAETKTVILPGIGHFGSWRSDLTIFNPDSQASALNLEFYSDQSELLASESGVILPSKGSLGVEDLLRSEVMNIEADVIGTLKVTTTSQNEMYPIIFGRTYNDQLTLGTFGQGIPAFAPSSANVTGEKVAYIPGARSDSSYYTNLGLVSLSSQPTSVIIRLLHPLDGEIVAARTETLQPGHSRIIAEVIANFLGSAAASGTIEIKVQSGGPVWAYASVIDRLTKDPEYVPGVQASSGTAARSEPAE